MSLVKMCLYVLCIFCLVWLRHTLLTALNGDIFSQMITAIIVVFAGFATIGTFFNG